MTKYFAEIDGGQGGDTTFKADTIKEAMVEAVEWAMDGDWPESGCDVLVRVWTDDEELTETVHIPSASEKVDQWLEDDGEVIAERMGEFSTERIVRVGLELYYTHPNGGSRGAHNRQDGDGVWKERPCSPSRKLDRTEARYMLLDWGWEPAEVATVTAEMED